MSDSAIIYTHTDEAPALATRSLLPIVRAFAGVAGVPMATRDISLAGRILAQFPDRLGDEAVSDDLAWLGELATTPEANIVKLPNISASIPQLTACIEELRENGYDLPDFTDDPQTDEEREVAAKYDVAKGSAVNPVLREGNSDRRAPQPVKNFAKKHPHSMTDLPDGSDAHVATMDGGDFYSNEQSVTVDREGTLRIEHVDADGDVTVLKDAVPVLEGEVVDASFMSRQALTDFLAEQVADAEERGVLFSVHLKATMMKVSDPIQFGHAVRAFFADVWAEHGDVIEGGQDDGGLDLDPDDGLGAVISGLEDSDDERAATILDAINDRIDDGPPLAYVNSQKGITNLHVPSDTIIDASMPAMIRNGCQLWGADDGTHDAKAVIPESSYAALYDETIKEAQSGGQYDPTTMGTVQNVGLMAKKAEEYGSHDKTFELDAPGTVRMVWDDSDEVVLSHEVEAGDTWRACQTKDAPIRDWVELAVRRAKATGWPIVFWLDRERAHDRELLAKVEPMLDELVADSEGDDVEVEILDVRAATTYTLDRVRRGEDTISVTGNVLRDYLTDLFPILEVGTSAKMLSIVPLMNGGVALRDRCRRLCAEARPADGGGGPPALGLARRVPRPRAVAGPLRRGRGQRRGEAARRDARDRDRAIPRGGPLTEPRGSTRSTTVAATSTSRSTGRGRWRTRTPMLAWPRRSRRSPNVSRRTRSRSTTSCWPPRAIRSTSAATTSSTSRRPTPRCARARRSTPSSRTSPTARTPRSDPGTATASCQRSIRSARASRTSDRAAGPRLPVGAPQRSTLTPRTCGHCAADSARNPLSRSGSTTTSLVHPLIAVVSGTTCTTRGPWSSTNWLDTTTAWRCAPASLPTGRPRSTTTTSPHLTRGQRPTTHAPPRAARRTAHAPISTCRSARSDAAVISSIDMPRRSASRWSRRWVRRLSRTDFDAVSFMHRAYRTRPVRGRTRGRSCGRNCRRFRARLRAGAVRQPPTIMCATGRRGGGRACRRRPRRRAAGHRHVR